LSCLATGSGANCTFSPGRITYTTQSQQACTSLAHNQG
jgi:hypothetical protein